MAAKKKLLYGLSFKKIISIIFLIAALFGALYALNLYTGFFDIRKSADYTQATLAEWTFNTDKEGWATNQFATSEVVTGTEMVSGFLRLKGGPKTAKLKNQGKAGIYSPQVNLSLPKGENTVKIQMRATGDTKDRGTSSIKVGVATGSRNSGRWNFKVFTTFEVPIGADLTEYSIKIDESKSRIKRLGLVFYNISDGSNHNSSGNRENTIVAEDYSTKILIDNIKVESSMYIDNTEASEQTFLGKLVKNNKKFYLKVASDQKLFSSSKKILLVPTSSSVDFNEFVNQDVEVTGYLTSDGWKIRFPTASGFKQGTAEWTNAEVLLSPGKSNGVSAIFVTSVKKSESEESGEEEGVEIASPEPKPIDPKVEECYLNLGIMNRTGEGMANPASIFCTCMGGILKSNDRCKVGGKTYGQWEYFDKMNPWDTTYSQCPAGGTACDDYCTANPGSIYCANR